MTEQEAELNALRTVWSVLWNEFAEVGGADVEWDRFLEIGEQAGLVVAAPYDIETHGEDLIGDPEPGDTIWILSPLGRRGFKEDLANLDGKEEGGR